MGSNQLNEFSHFEFDVNCLSCHFGEWITAGRTRNGLGCPLSDGVRLCSLVLCNFCTVVNLSVCVKLCICLLIHYNYVTMHCVFVLLSPPVLAICLEFALCLVMLKLHSRSSKDVVHFVKLCMLTLEVLLDFACNL